MFGWSNQLNTVESVGKKLYNGRTFVRHSGADQAPAADDSRGFP